MRSERCALLWGAGMRHDVGMVEMGRRETFDAIVVGSGPTGSLMARRLVESGISVVVLEAGLPYAAGELQNKEANAGRIMWSEPRRFVGADFVMPKAGMGVGGGTLP